MTNKFLSFLKKAGEVIVNAAGIAAGIGPLITPYLSAKAQTVEGTAVGDLQQIGGIVTTIEAAFTAVSSASTGPLKLQAAAPLVSQIIQQSTLLAGKKIGDPTTFNKGVVDVTNGIVEILNACEPGDVGQVNSTGAQPLSSTGATAAPSPAAVIPPTTPTTPAS